MITGSGNRTAQPTGLTIASGRSIAGSSRSSFSIVAPASASVVSNQGRAIMQARTSWTPSCQIWVPAPTSSAQLSTKRTVNNQSRAQGSAYCCAAWPSSPPSLPCEEWHRPSSEQRQPSSAHASNVEQQRLAALEARLGCAVSPGKRSSFCTGSSRLSRLGPLGLLQGVAAKKRTMRPRAPFGTRSAESECRCSTKIMARDLDFETHRNWAKKMESRFWIERAFVQPFYSSPALI